MSGGVNQMENIFLAILRPIFQLNCIQLNCNAAFPFQIQRIQNLIHHFSMLNGIGHFQNPIR